MKVDYALKAKIYKLQNEIAYYSQIQLLVTYPYQKSFYENIIKEKNQKLNNLMKEILNKSNEENDALQNQKEFTLEELAIYDGANGRDAYVAVDGIVYDVSKEATWGGGTHFGLYAGKDLSSQFMGCHEGMIEILNKLPKIGILINE